MSKNKSKYLLLSPGLLLILLAYFIPLILLFILSFYTYVSGSGLTDFTFTLENYVRLLEPYYLDVLVKTFLIALAATVTALILGYPIALWMVRCKPKYRKILLAVVITPLLTNVVARTLGLMIVFGTSGPINKLLQLFGLPKVKLIPGYAGIIIGLTQVFIPYMILSIKSVLENINFNLEDAARDLGYSKRQAFWKVVFPLSTPGIYAGCLFVFLLSFSSFVTPRLLGGGLHMVMTMLIYQQGMTLLNWPFASAISMVLLVFSLILVTASNKTTSKIEKMGNRNSQYNASKFSVWFKKYKNKWYDISCGIHKAWFKNLPEKKHQINETAYFHWIKKGLQYLILLFIVLPLPIVILSSFSESSRISFPPSGYSLKWYLGLFEKTEYIRSFLLSLRLALCTVILSLVIGVMVSLGLTRYKFKGIEFLKTIFLSPLMLPAVITGIALLRFFVMFGWVATFQGLLTAHVLLASAYVTRMVLSSLVGFDLSVEEAARDLGASPWYTFRKVTFPLIKPGLIVAALFAFIVSLDETTISVFLTGGSTITLPVRIFSQLEHGVDPTVTAVSSLLILFSLIALWIIDRTLGLDKFKM